MKSNFNDNKLTGSMISSPLFRRFLMTIVMVMLTFTLAFYFLAVPYLKKLVYSLEEKAIQTNLQNIHKLIQANSLAIEAYKESVTSAHKRQLKNITLFMETYLKNKYEQVQAGIITKEEAKKNALQALGAFRYGKNDYVWVADYRGFYIAHPDPRMNRQDFSKVRDVFGNYVITPLIQQTMEKGEGYHSFWWQRMENDLPAEKLTYAKLFPQWEWVIGTEVYLDELESEIILRREKMIEELRQILKNISIAETGYMYVFDSWRNIIIHPDAELENTDMSSWKNPVTGNLLSDDLIAATHREENKVAYKWNQSDDKDNYIYDKIDWVTHVDDFDWYLAASVYTGELNKSSIFLRNRIILMAVAGVILSIIVISLLISRLLDPIRRLSHVAGQVEAGDLSARSDVKGRDEIGFLASAFNSMIAQLRDVIQGLDHKVLERTKALNQTNEELTSTVGKMEQYNREVTQLNRLAEKLNTCNSLNGVYQVIAESLSELFQQASGILYMCSTDSDNDSGFKPVITWGWHVYPDSEHLLHKCRSLVEEKVVIVDLADESVSSCEHIRADLPWISICMPLLVRNEKLGMINLIYDGELKPREKEHMFQNWQRLATNAADYLAMSLANMKLREKLQYLSVRDGLTGLFNRRYMEETLEREVVQAERSKRPVGVIMADVDFFKQLNDTYGHKAGDIVLIELAKLLVNITRKGDVVCRYGGEEFLIILPGASVEQIIQRAEIIRDKVENELKVLHNNELLRITVSLGAAAYPDHGSSPDDVLKAADNALYRAKEQGRNMAISSHLI
ncbi:MAG: diguanylate cyclase [Nitrospiraceae bacterium]|nr:MAG: diguanylate cyclase [Nitrospiraceae bacterium]